MKFNKKRTLVVAFSAIAILAIGGVIAYNNDAMFFNNLFHLGSSTLTATEHFDAPSDWQPCEEIPKTATVTNTTDKPMFIRMKIEEYWKKNGSTSTTHETEIPLVYEGKKAAVINTQNETDWNYASDDYYYFDTVLMPGESTTSLLKSVTLNCELNFVGELEWSDDHQTAETKQNDYQKAQYHVFVTFEGSTVEWAYHPSHDCDSPILYNIIACQTNGPDTNISFNSPSLFGNPTYGVNTLSAHQSDDYPVYYYRGPVTNNNVIFDGACWHILRTTSTGGVKLMYNGKASANNTCDTTYNDRSYYPTISNTQWNTNNVDLEGVGYVKGTHMAQVNESYHEAGSVFGQTVDYHDGKYYLQDTFTVSDWGVNKDTVRRYHHYHCYGGASLTECEKVHYIFMTYDDLNTEQAIELTGGDTFDTVKANLNSYTANSSAKTIIDKWVDDGIGSNETIDPIKNHLNMLEDTPWCNERNQAKGGLVSLESAFASPIFYPARTRVGINDGIDLHPSVDCAKKDAFTVTETEKGNGALTYPVALPTADEIMLAGAFLMENDSAAMNGNQTINYSAKDTTYFTGRGSTCNWNFTMSPATYYTTSTSGASVYMYTCAKLSPIKTYDSAYITPALSLRKGTVVTSGEGTEAKPYIIRM